YRMERLMKQNGERVTLRERIAAAVFDAERRPGFGRSQDDYFDVADAVLDALGLEQVGWVWPDDMRLLRMDQHHEGYSPEYEPVYRLRPSGRTHHACRVVVRDEPLSYAGDIFEATYDRENEED